MSGPKTFQFLPGYSARVLASGLIAALLTASCDKSPQQQQSEGNPKTTSPAKRPTTTKPAQLRPESTAEFGARIQKLGLPELRELWDTLDTSDLSQDEKRFRQCQIIERLSQSGDIEEAMKLVSRYGQGLHRDALVFSLYAKSPAPLATLFARMRGSDFSNSDRNTLLHALTRNIAGPGGYAKVSELLATNPKLNSLEAGALGAGLAAGIDLGKMGLQYYEDPDISAAKLTPAQLQANYTAAESTLQSAMNAYPAMKSDLLSAFFQQAGEVAPFKCWDTLVANYTSITASERTERLHELAREMFTQNPQLALTSLESMRDKESIAPLIRSGAIEWARGDIAAVETWFSGTDNHLPKPEADSLAHGVARFLAEDDRPAEGWKWVGRIDDPELRRKAEGQVWSQEKKMVEAESKANPQAVIETIVAGNSVHADYWIETALNEWIQQDENAARKWYDDHSSSLTPKQTEAVSLTYARLALNDGDVETARKWAAQVTTPKMKTKIDNEISTKASGN